MKAIQQTMALTLLSLAFFNPAHGQETRAELFKNLEAVSPTLASALDVVGKSYVQKCGAEPSVEQFRLLAKHSEAFLFLASMSANGHPVEVAFPSPAAEKYKELADKQVCF